MKLICISTLVGEDEEGISELMGVDDPVYDIEEDEDPLDLDE